MFDFNNLFTGIYGKVGSGMCRFTANGGVAVKCTTNGKTSYKTYDVAKGTLTNVTNFCFSPTDEMFFVLPTNKVRVGDIILVNEKPKCVIDVTDKRITAIDYETSEEKVIVPERHVFMGKTYFYGKFVSPFGGMFKGNKGLGGVMKTGLMMQFLKQMMGGGSNGFNFLGMGNVGANNANSNNGGDIMSAMGPLMMMNMLGGGSGNMFGDMFGDMLGDLDLDFDMTPGEPEDDGNRAADEDARPYAAPVRKSRKSK